MSILPGLVVIRIRTIKRLLHEHGVDRERKWLIPVLKHTSIEKCAKHSIQVARRWHREYNSLMFQAKYSSIKLLFVSKKILLPCFSFNHPSEEQFESNRICFNQLLLQDTVERSEKRTLNINLPLLANRSNKCKISSTSERLKCKLQEEIRMPIRNK